MDLIAAYVIVLFRFLREGYTLSAPERMRADERRRLIEQHWEQKDSLQAQALQLAHLAWSPGLNPNPVIQLDAACKVTCAKPSAKTLLC